MHGVNMREIGFCSSNGLWNEDENSLLLDMWKSFVFEDSPVGRHTGETLRKTHAQVKIWYEFTGPDRKEVKLAYISLENYGDSKMFEELQASVNWNWAEKKSNWLIRQVLPKDDEAARGTGREPECQPGDPDCMLRLSNGARSSPEDSYYLRRLWKADERPTRHAARFLDDFTMRPALGFDWSAEPLKPRYWRYATTAPPVARGMDLTKEAGSVLVLAYVALVLFLMLRLILDMQRITTSFHTGGAH